MTTEQRLAKLERTNRLWQWLAGTLALLLTALVSMGQVGPVPKELLLKKLTISDGKGGPEIVLVSRNEKAVVAVIDSGGTPRISAAVEKLGFASVAHYDLDGNQRITTGTASDGLARIIHSDTNGQNRIETATFPSGNAGVSHYDAKGGNRVATLTSSDGTAGTMYANYNGNGDLEIIRSLP